MGNRKSDILLAAIREGKPMGTNDKLNLIVSLSIPSILAQITSVLMFFIDASMVGHLGAEASAAIGLVESTTWLFGSLTSAASMGFSVQVAHFVGANDFQRARQVFRHGLVCTSFLSVFIVIVCLLIYRPLPYWLGGGADIAHDASLYFLIFVLSTPFFMFKSLSGAMLKCSGNMRIPSIISVTMCLLDVMFNYLFIFVMHLGVMGAAIGSALAIFVAACLEGYFAIVRSEMLSLLRDNEPFRWVPDYVKNALKIASPMALQSTLMSGAHDDCGAVGQFRHCRQHLCHHRREPLLHAWVWYWRCCNNIGGSKSGCWAQRHLPFVCPYDGRNGYVHHGVDGCADVRFRS